MASINMCDRCGAMGLAIAIGTIVYHTGPNAPTVKKELCPDCVGELVVWDECVPTRETRNAFREPWARTLEIEKGDSE